MPTQPEFFSSVQAVQSTAVFFHTLAHKLDAKDLTQGADVLKLAQKRRLKIPAALDGFSVTYNGKPHSMTASEMRRTIVVELPPELAKAKKKKTFTQCFDVKRGPFVGKVCVECTASWTAVSCKITITIKIGF